MAEFLLRINETINFGVLFLLFTVLATISFDESGKSDTRLKLVYAFSLLSLICGIIGTWTIGRGI